jgi:membrane protein implicated in regulation of membrane protease activity
MAAYGGTVLLLWLIPDLHTRGKITSVAGGLALGILAGALTWRQIRRRIFAGNRVVLYFVDSFAFSLLCVAGVATLLPQATLRGGLMAILSPDRTLAILLGVASMGLATSGTLYVRIRAHERRHGPLVGSRFYAPSVTGPEAMLGRRGVVLRACVPEGTVRVGGELWAARSLVELRLSEGAEVIVRDVEGLCLLVEPLPPKTILAPPDR